MHLIDRAALAVIAELRKLGVGFGAMRDQRVNLQRAENLAQFDVLGLAAQPPENHQPLVDPQVVQTLAYRRIVEIIGADAIDARAPAQPVRQRLDRQAHGLFSPSCTAANMVRERSSFGSVKSGTIDQHSRATACVNSRRAQSVLQERAMTAPLLPDHAACLRAKRSRNA